MRCLRNVSRARGWAVVSASIAEFLEKQARHARTAAASQHAGGRGRRGSIASLVFSPLGEFAKQIVARAAWRDGWRGWAAASASSAAVAMKHACLLELSLGGKDIHRGGPESAQKSMKSGHE